METETDLAYGILLDLVLSDMEEKSKEKRCEDDYGKIT